MATAYLEDEDEQGRRRPGSGETPDTPDLPNYDPAPQDSAPAPSAPSFDPEAWVREQSRQAGVSMEQSDIDKLREKNPEDRAKFQQDLEAQYKLRASPTSSRQFDSQSGYYDTYTHQPIPGTPAALAITNAQNYGRVPGASRTNFQYQNPGDQFDDPYTKALEDLVKQQLESLKQPQQNPQLDKLLAFLDTQFQQRSTSPGYTDAELGLLRTQSLDPIERDRAAAQRRSLERTASRGFLPSSGLAELDSRESDIPYDQMRAAAQRDLGINAINKRNQDLAQALTLGQLSGVTIPQMQRNEDQGRRNEALSLASLLYQLPRNAMNDSLAVINGSPLPQDLFNQAIQLISAQENQRRYSQQRNDAFWESIGETLAGIFG